MRTITTTIHDLHTDHQEVMRVATFQATDVVVWLDMDANPVRYYVLEVPNAGPGAWLRQVAVTPTTVAVFDSADETVQYGTWQEAVAYALSLVTTADGDPIRYFDNMMSLYTGQG
jgi:hypothetical protein